MWTVPAQGLRAPTRAQVIAASRSIPRVRAVLESSRSPGITCTPPRFQRDTGLSCCGLLTTPTPSRLDRTILRALAQRVNMAPLSREPVGHEWRGCAWLTTGRTLRGREALSAAARHLSNVLGLDPVRVLPGQRLVLAGVGRALRSEEH